LLATLYPMLELVHNFLKKPILYLRQKLSDKNFFIFSSILVGTTSGLAAILLKYFVHSIESLVHFSSSNYKEFLPFAVFPFFGIMLTVVYVRYFLNGQLEKGSSSIVYTIIKKSSNFAPRNIYAHLVTSGLTVGFGGSVGLESPMVSTGAAIGSNYSQSYNLSYKDRTILLACGAAAGISAAFNAPIAGVLFAVEVLLADVSATAFIPLIIASACGALVSKIVLKEGVILSFTLQQPFDYHNTVYYILLGLLAGIVSLLYARIFTKIERGFSGIANIWRKAIGGGILLVIIMFLFPPLFGEGYETIKYLAEQNTGPLIKASPLNTFIENESGALLFLAALIVFKIIAAAVTLGSGGSGGSFAPSLFIGAYLGYVFSRIINITNLANIPQSNFTLVAMAGILSGVFYAPLTAIFLIAELTGGYGLIIPLMIVSSLSRVVVSLFQPMSMEGKKLAERLNITIENRDRLLLSRLDLNALIETNFLPVSPDEKLGSVVKTIAASNRNIFPVLDKSGSLVGLIYLDKIRNIIFDPTQYEKSVADLMQRGVTVVEIDESLHEALIKFDKTGQWNLPVVDNGKYLGFLSKSSILTKYRNELLETV
jgi:chloride channel protein, CIC family